MTATSDHDHTGADCCNRADCCTTTNVESEAVDEIRSHDVSPEVAALRAAGFRLLLDERRPIGMEEWAEAASVDPSGVEAVLGEHSGRVELDELGRLVGIAGLTIRPTAHELSVNGDRHWTWCALDAVGILGALEATGSVRSIDPSTNDQVNIAFDEGRAQSDATIFVLSGYDGADIRGEWCPLVNFFNNRSDAETWVEDNRLRGDLLAVQEIAPQAADLWRAVTAPRD